MKRSTSRKKPIEGSTGLYHRLPVPIVSKSLPTNQNQDVPKKRYSSARHAAPKSYNNLDNPKRLPTHYYHVPDYVRRSSAGLTRHTIKELELTGYHTLKAIRLMSEDDLRDIDISLGQRSLLRGIVTRLNRNHELYDKYRGSVSKLLMVGMA